MFIAYTKKNIKYTEGSDHEGRAFTWEDIPMDTSITALSLTHPIPFIINNDKRISPKVSIKKYHYYYFFNEATFSIVQSKDGGFKQEGATLVAKVMAGINVEKEYVTEVRLDKFGNTSIRSHSLDTLVNKFETGQMRKSILRPGIDCPPEKKLL